VAKAASDALLKEPERAELHLALAFANAGLGLADAARSEGRKAAELLPPSRDAISGSTMQMYLAQILARIGDLDAAFTVLQALPGQMSGVQFSAALLKLDSFWDPLRGDPRFGAVAAALEKPLEIKAAP
jgi:hypothetical protein